MTQKKKPSTLLEKLSQSEHVKWIAWTKTLYEKIPIPPDVEKAWRKNWVTYTKLPEEVKNMHRVWAKRSMYLLKAFFKTQFIVQLNHSKFVEVMKKFKQTGMDDNDIEELYNCLNKRKGLFSAKERKK